MIKRILKLPLNPKRSFFFWGPRQTGKTSLLKANEKSVKKALVVSLDLLPRTTEDNIEILPALVFAKRLWEGKIF